MYKILKIEEDKISIGTSDGKIITAPITAFNYDGPQIGDEVKIFGEAENMIISRCLPGTSQDAQPQMQQQAQGPGPYQQNSQMPYSATEKRINKHLFIWLGAFAFGAIRVDRFMRGQVGLGILKILTCGGGGIWCLVDWIIGLSKAYGNSFGQDEELTFINGKYAQ